MTSWAPETRETRLRARIGHAVQDALERERHRARQIGVVPAADRRTPRCPYCGARTANPKACPQHLDLVQIECGGMNGTFA